MKIKPKKPLDAVAESKSGIPHGDSSGDSSGAKNGDSNTAKAKKIFDLGYSQRSLATLERLPKAELDFILKNKRDPQSDELSKESIKASKEIIKGYIDVCDTIKQARCNELLNPALSKLALTQDTALSEIVSSGASGKTGLAILIISLLALAIDAIIGIDKAKKLLKKPEPESKKDDSSNETK